MSGWPLEVRLVPRGLITGVDAELAHRTARFIATVMPPVTCAFAFGAQAWQVYAVLGAITGFVGDEGGEPPVRLRYMLVGPGALVAGAACGSVTGPHETFIVLTILLGLFYGLVEGGHPHLLILARFAGYGLVLGSTVATLQAVDALAAGVAALLGWALSLAWDAARRLRRPLAVQPMGAELRQAIGRWRCRWPFAAAAGMSIGAANAVGLWIGLGHAYWATLTILVVLRGDMAGSAEAITHRVSGTLLGVAVAAGLITLTSGPGQLFVAMVIIAAFRWPAMRVDLTLGTASITAFVLLVADLLAASPDLAMVALRDRLLATMVGCCFALAGLGLLREAARLVGWLRTASTPK